MSLENNRQIDLKRVFSVPGHEEKREMQPEKDDRKPFIIRGHHLNGLLQIHQGMPAIDEAISSRKVSVDRGDTDYVGTTVDEANKYEKELYNVLIEFAELPDSAPVKLVDNQKDGMCNACIHGEHCTVKLEDPVLDRLDGLYLESFRKSAMERGIEDRVTPIVETAEYTNAPPEQVTSYLTDVGTVRRVFDKDTAKGERRFGIIVDEVIEEFEDKGKNTN
jgi:hypothetical protein